MMTGSYFIIQRLELQGVEAICVDTIGDWNYRVLRVLRSYIRADIIGGWNYRVLRPYV